MKTIKFKLIIKILCSFLLSLCLQTDVKALITDSLRNGDVVEGPYYYAQNKAEKGFWDSFRYIERVSNGQFVYCIEPLVHIKNSEIYDIKEGSYLDYFDIDEQTWDRITKIAYFGYKYKEEGIDHDAPKWYVAAQMMIWQLADPNCESYFTKTVHGERDDTILQEEIAEINHLVDTFDEKPNFINFPTKLLFNQKVEIKDAKNVLSKYTVENIRNAIIQIKNNSLSIDAYKLGNVTFELHRNGKFYHTPTRLFYSPNSQMAIEAGKVKPISHKYSTKTVGHQIIIQKSDYDTGLNKPVGDASLENAIYGVYDQTGKIGEITTDKDGEGVLENIKNPGTYYIQEIKPSQGYQLDKTRYSVTINETDFSKTIKVLEKVQKRPFSILKVYASNKTEILKPEPDITFDIYLKSSHKKITSITTNQDGYATTTLPYGTYIVHQVNSPLYYEKIEDFEIKIDKDTTEPLHKTIANRGIEAKVKVVKKNQETLERVPIKGIKFKIKNLDTDTYVCTKITYPTVSEVCEYETNEQGEFYTVESLPIGHYQLEEINQFIPGYIWNSTPLLFEIGTTDDIKHDATIGNYIELSFLNRPKKGQIEIIKVGEKLIYSNNSYHYENIPLKDVVFELYSKEDVIINGQLFKKGEIIETLKTDSSGQAISRELPLGKYYIQEIFSNEGNMVNSKIFEIDLKDESKNQNTVLKSIEISNFLPKGKLEFIKYGPNNKLLPNAVIQIFTLDDVCIFEGLTNNEGKIYLENLPLGNYYLIEKMAPHGYLKNDEKVFFEIKKNDDLIKISMLNHENITTENIKLPDTEKNTSYASMFIGIIFSLLGLSFTVYEKIRQD